MRWKGGRPSRGQAMVEFALVLPFLLVLVLGDVEAHLYFAQAAMADHAASLGVLAAAGASPDHPDQPDLDGAYRIAAAKIESADLRAARLAPMPPAPGSDATVCPPLNDQWPIGVIYVCVVSLPHEHAVSVTAEGWISAPVPPTFGLKLGWRPGALPITTPPHYLHATYYAA